MATQKQLRLQWIDAFVAADIVKLVSLYHPNVVDHQVANEPLVGHAAIQQMFVLESGTASMNCIVDQIFEDGEWVIMEWMDPFGLQGCGFFHVVDDHIVF